MKMIPNSISARVARKVLHSLSSRTDTALLKYALRSAEVANATSITSWTTKHELKALYELALSCPPDAKALEVGSYLGASTCYIAAGLTKKGGHLYCVDTWHNETMPEGERDTLTEFRKNTQGIRSLITEVRKRSEELTTADVQAPLDLVFLDGDHSYSSIKEDFAKVTPWVSDTGTVAFHDCAYFVGVSRVIGEALATGEWMLAGHINNLLWIKRAAFEK